ncbi:protein-export membrane protein SecD [Candidatus Woesebacteria bacterium RIFCSPHIGHO2_02_FULL_38_9]|uniref:Protein translocase subunit SecD n=1 Tax=Candidatus Woesebacteria bacterium RIFCSPHIGHO2_01_FULL_39_28 TaxID=1802496 RepID=A0A1F7YHB6_9BACT|nr:MAG: protein-export membrane protein SecD [Candidatus Woesebacteria bacterium RIFCSPHIGHO2_01_FULL_39_28]OGM31709.1 MAG: protein-export membrane protein SecD [Candidatus Woesebacteria bacterium RIFCSPHIGHO2_02_FULL_38_9]OGM57649.1 MAG: protein-export membrane protein SecD [Candidatus Woesebacteria bacterium RIFCSPLOWO2_01_FULL_38_20]
MRFPKPAKRVFLIFILTLFALWIDLPAKVSLGDKTIGHPVIKQRSLDLVLGLDLAGGSHLVFEADTTHLAKEKKELALSGVRDVIERRVNLFGVSEPNVQAASFENHDRVIVELPGINDTKQAVDLIGKTAQLVFAEVDTATSSGGLIPTKLTGADLADAKVVFDKTSGKPSVSIEFSKEGGLLFSDLTEKNVGKPLAILLDNSLVSAPTVQEKISGGSAQISGNFSLDEAKALAIQLNAGALPVSVKLVEERTVGATLGSESVEKSIKAGIVGLLMVLLFMILAYGRLGIVAGVGLLIFGILTLALYKIIPVVLTLPGIAGFLLSVGMAVDSNILIFERFKEERIRRPVVEALEISFGRAWDSIRDANIATLVTAFVLANPFDWAFLNTSGPVRGFAITLALGIGISLFTGIVVSRNLLRLFIRK